ncbi:hypothetical protein TWF192_005959 [Orbilia oligospora]|uniref:FAD linked oxidase N-terminal domain-containing protein n=1 Tax=Orbilia oligospora TaxID=2813651 RepID=A0A6G1MNA7_ORBOL|nr:hypothetical protein TWF191_001358 [Orbilia oligospora]KAF3263685.1 hypothetical protein TWF192_005959 [Orbilia oligospora]
MLRKIKQSEYLLAAFCFTLAACASQQSCKCRPSDPCCWPALNDWNQLNDTVNRHVIQTTPPGTARYPGEFHNKIACEMITSVYQSSDLIAKTSYMIDFRESTGAYALSIFTHYWQEAQFHSDFTSECCAVSTKGQNAVTISPRMQWQDMHRFADEHSSIIVGGGASTVGCIGGFLQSGGHSPLSSIYGLAMDQVLEMKVVLPSGEYITANDYQNQEIY